MAQQLRHLDARGWGALQADPKADPELFEHVAAGCEVCDAVIAAQADALDGAIDRALLSLAPRAEAPLDELGWMRVRRALRSAPKGRRFMGVGLVLAAMLTVTVGAIFARSPADARPTPDGIKGSATTGPRLQLAAARKRSASSFVRLDDGAQLEQGSVLVFQATSSIEGPARVFMQRQGSAPVEVGETALEAGTHEVQTEKGILGVTLEGERGDVTVWVVVGEGPFSATDALEAISTRGSSSLGVAQVHVHVE